MLNPKNSLRHSSTVFSVLIIISISLWYFTDFTITKWGNVTLTTSNFLESYYWTKRDIFWQKSLDHIQNLENKQLKTLLLEKYVQFIPVDQWWSPIRRHKVNALCSILEAHQQQQNWPSLEKYSQEFIKINPTAADPWYYLGNSQIKQGQNPKAYEQALSIDATHLPTIKAYAHYLFDHGQYQKARSIIQPYLNRIQTPNKICFWWGQEIFTPDKRLCSYPAQSNLYILPINIVNSYQQRIRLNLPQGRITIKKIDFVRINKTTISLDKFDNWTLSPDLKKDPDNLFYSTGPDPFLYTTLPDTTKLSAYDQLHIHVNSDSNLDPEMQPILSLLQTKINETN